MKQAKSNYQFTLEPKNLEPIQTKHRVIQTQIPHPEDIKTFEQIMTDEIFLIQPICRYIRIFRW